MKTGLMLSGGGTVGTYQTGMAKALAECGTQVSMVSGASIDVFNDAIIAASPDLSEAAARLKAFWGHSGDNQMLSVNRLVCFSLLKELFQAMNLCQAPGRAGALLMTLLHHISILNGFDNLMAQPLLSDEPLMTLLDHHLDIDALTDGLPLYMSLYPIEGDVQDIIGCARAELGTGTMKNTVFQHVQNLPRGQQEETLLASAALSLLFRPRRVQRTMFGGGGMGGWRNVQGDTPVTPLIDAGCNMVIVTHLNDGSLWDHQAFPDTTIFEVHPRRRLRCAGDGDNSSGLLGFTLTHIDAWRQRDYEDTMLTVEHIRKSLAVRQVLSRSETVLQKSPEITEGTGLALRSVMARIKQKHPKETPPPVVVFFLAGIIEDIFRYILPERKFYPPPISSLAGNLIMQLPIKLLMGLIPLVDVIARAGKHKNYIRDEIKYWRYASYKGGEFPEGFIDEKFSNAIYNGRMFTMKRLHTLMLFLAILFTGFNVEATSVK